MFGKKSNEAYSLSIRVQTTLNHISICFFTTISTLKVFFFFFSEHELKKHCSTHRREQCGMDSNRQRQISQSDCEISNNCDKIFNSNPGYGPGARFSKVPLVLEADL